MSDKVPIDCSVTCQAIKRVLDQLFPARNWQVTEKHGQGSKAYADAIQGIPDVICISLDVPSVPLGKIYKQLCVDIPGEEFAQATTDAAQGLLLQKYCGQLAAWRTSSSALKPSTKSNFSAKFLNHIVASDSPICLHNEKTGETLEYATTGEALAAYFLFGHAPNTTVNDLSILCWNNDRWVILAPEGLMK